MSVKNLIMDVRLSFVYGRQRQYNKFIPKFFVIVLVALCLVSCKEQSIRTILNPSVAKIPERLSIDKVILTDVMTVIDFTYDMMDGSYVFIAPDSYIQVEGDKYKLVGTKNIFTEDRTAELVHFKKATFSLIFQPIPKWTKKFDFYESADQLTGSGWKIIGVDLTSNLSAIEYDKLDAGKAYVAILDSIIDLYQRQQQMQKAYTYDYAYTKSENEYYYYCQKCNTLLTATKSNEPRSSSGQCRGVSHLWRCYGPVGNDVYECVKCGMSLRTSGPPRDTTGCPADTNLQHRWVQRY